MSRKYLNVSEAIKHLSGTSINFRNYWAFDLPSIDYFLKEIESFIKEKNIIIPLAKLKSLKEDYKTLSNAKKRILECAKTVKKINEASFYEEGEKSVIINDSGLFLSLKDELKLEGYDIITHKVTPEGIEIYFS